MVLYQVTEVNLSLICEKRMITLKSIAFNLRAVNKMVCKALIAMLKADGARSSTAVASQH